MSVVRASAYKILEITDSSEYNALSDANKEAYKMIISCGSADIATGTVLRTKLDNMFGEGSVTHTNLIELERSLLDWVDDMIPDPPE